MKAMDIIGICIMVVIAVGIIAFLIKRDGLKDDRIITKGKITRIVQQTGKHAKPCLFTYFVEGKKYEETFVKPDFCSKILSQKEVNDICQLEFPVLCHPSDHSFAKILFERADYRYYKIKVPKWLNKFMKKYIDCDNTFTIDIEQLRK